LLLFQAADKNGFRQAAAERLVNPIASLIIAGGFSHLPFEKLGTVSSNGFDSHIPA